MTYQEAKQHLARKLDIDYSDIANNDLFSDTDLGEFIKLAVIKAWDYKPWDFSEGDQKATTIDTDYYDYPQRFRSGSIYLLTVGGKEYRPVLFQDYMKTLQDDSTSTERLWSEHKRFIFVNKNAYTIGDEMVLFGKLMPPVLSDSSDLLPFSPDTDNYEHSGNEAIVLIAYGEALSSEKMNDPQKGEIERGKGYQLLDLLWEPFKNARSLMQSKDRPMFDVPDFFGNSTAQSIGNFDYLN